MRSASRSGQISVGPTVEQYRRAHPQVDWETHEVLYSVLNAGRMSRDGFMVTMIQSHHRKIDLDELRRTLDHEDGLPPGTHEKWDQIEAGRHMAQEDPDDDD